MTIYSAFLPSQLKEALTKAVLANMSSATVVYPVYARVRIYAWVILGIIALVTVVMGLFVWLLADDFGWAVRTCAAVGVEKAAADEPSRSFARWAQIEGSRRRTRTTKSSCVFFFFFFSSRAIYTLGKSR